MSAESNSMSGATDRHLYGRLIIDRLLFGERLLSPDWRTSMKLAGGIVADAKSLYDHLSTTGQLPSERQTMLDLMVSRHHIESGAIELYWVPTHRQFGDTLTKRMTCQLWRCFFKKPYISLRETEGSGLWNPKTQAATGPAAAPKGQDEGLRPTIRC